MRSTQENKKYRRVRVRQGGSSRTTSKVSGSCTTRVENVFSRALCVAGDVRTRPSFHHQPSCEGEPFISHRLNLFIYIRTVYRKKEKENILQHTDKKFAFPKVLLSASKSY